MCNTTKFIMHVQSPSLSRVTTSAPLSSELSCSSMVRSVFVSLLYKRRYVCAHEKSVAGKPPTAPRSIRPGESLVSSFTMSTNS